MAEFRSIHTRIWTDQWFSDLGTEERLLFIYLFSNERASVCGMYELPLKYIAFETGISKERVCEILKSFETAGKVYYRDGYVWVVNLRKYNETSSDKVRVRIDKDLEAIPNNELKEMYYRYRMDTLSGNGERNGNINRYGNIDGYINGDGNNTDTPPDNHKPQTPPGERGKLISAIEAETIYRQVTGFMSIPSYIREEATRLICDVASRKGDGTTDYLRPFYLEWCNPERKTKNDKPYSKLGKGWLDWAVAETIPPIDQPKPVTPAPHTNGKATSNDLMAAIDSA